MTDVSTPAPSPAPSPAPAEPSSTPIEGDILDTLGLSDTSNAGAPLPNDAPGGPPPAEPGEAVGSAPASPETPPAGAPAPAPAPPPPAPTEGPPPAPAAPAPSEPPAAAPPADSEAALREASLRAQLDAAIRTLEELRASPQGTPAPAGTPPSAPSPEGQPAEQPFRYSLTLPEAVQQRLMSDDPKENIQAINAIVNDLGTIVHNTVLTQVRSEVRAAFSTLIGMSNASTANQTQEQSREAARENYFKAFPTHKNELIEPIIRQQAIALSSEHPGLPFNDQYINALGARVNTALEQLGAKPKEPEPASEQPASGGQPPARPAAHLPTGTRGPDVTRTSGNLGEDIMGTLDPFSG